MRKDCGDAGAEIPEGRVFQDENFEIPWLSSAVLEELISLEDPSQGSREPIIVFIKVRGQQWQQFFLDAGIGIWEHWGDFEKEEDESWYQNYTDQFGLKGATIKRVCCEKSQIKVEFIDGRKLWLQYTNSSDFDSSCELRIDPVG